MLACIVGEVGGGEGGGGVEAMLEASQNENNLYLIETETRRLVLVSL
jgi:hypothetical protein